MSLVTYSPFRLFETQLSRDPLFRDLLRGFDSGAAPDDRPTLLVPRMNVEEKDTHWLLTLELPGLSRDDIHVEVDKGRLAVWGEKKVERAEDKKDRKVHVREISYGSFRRELVLPETVAADQISASYDNGHLVLNLPKVPATAARKIEIKV